MVSPAVAPQLESSRSVASLEFACEGRVFSSGASGFPVSGELKKVPLENK